MRSAGADKSVKGAKDLQKVLEGDSLHTRKTDEGRKKNMQIIFIRHGKTAGNLEKRYIGKTDEPLCEQGIADLKTRSAAGLYPAADRVIVSPMKRCLETAAILYPQQKPVVVQDLRECDFGVFEGKNYAELNGDTAYQRWIDSAGMAPPPGGEGKADFAKRCCESFWKALEDCGQQERIAVVVHGGTIMALLEAFGVPKRGFYDYQLENGGVYLAECDRKMRELRKVGMM